MPNSSGTLRVRAYTAGGALPVEGAVVRVMGAGEDNRLVSFSIPLLTPLWAKSLEL